MELAEIIERTEFEPVLSESPQDSWVAFLDRELKVVSTNPDCRRLFGWDPDAIVGRRLGDLANLAPLTSLVVAGFCFRAEPALVGGMPVICSYVPITEEGRTAGGFLSVAADPGNGPLCITEASTNLARALGPLMDIVQDGLVVINREGFITLVNQHFADALGVRAQDLIGKDILTAYSNSKTSRLPVVMETGKAEVGWPHLINGREVVACRYPLFKDGQTIGALGRILFRDVREVTLLANQINTLMGEEGKAPATVSRHCDFNYDINSIVGKSRAMRKLKETMMRVASRNSSVLLVGESGTGKELLAHSIHAGSPRRYGPFIKVNCAAIPEHLLESELFGYADGAFTGAKRGGQVGKFELAHNGTLFLDEISDMSLTMQAKLLRVLQEKEVTPLGSDTTRKFDVRVVAATNVNMEKLVEEERFRSDLYYRLNIVSVLIPPLRQRLEDLPAIVGHFIDTFNAEFGLNVKRLAAEAWEVLNKYSFPGNIRELRNVVESAFNVVRGPEIRKSDLPERVLAATSRIPTRPGELVAAAGLEAGDDRPLPRLLEDVEKYLIEGAIERAEGNKIHAAALLGISRPGLYKKLQKYRMQ